ncbi:MAG: envelope stress response membrane protein PspC [Pseudomonadota bacterium]
MRKLNNFFRGGLHRSRNGMILGVCKGLAEYFDFSVFWTRTISLILLFITGFWPTLALYFIAALLMKPEPVLPIHEDDEQEFYDSYVHSRKGAVDRLKRRYDNLDRRIQRMEDSVTKQEFDWERRLNNT